MTGRADKTRRTVKKIRRAKKVKVSELKGLDFLGSEASSILELPPPEETNLARAGVKSLVSVAKTMLTGWIILIEGKEPTMAHYKWTCPYGHEHQLDQRGIRDRMLLVAVGYYDASVRLLISRRDEFDGLPPGIRLSLLESVTPSDHWMREHDGDLIAVRFASMYYFHSLFYAYFTRILRTSSAPQGITDVFERNFHNCLLSMHSTNLQPLSWSLKASAHRMLRGLLELGSALYSELMPHSTTHMPGVFSAIRLDELSALATRKSTAIKRYGVKQLEKTFEWQLALIVQSFGLQVVSTRTGDRTVDLLCISGSPNQSTFLLEAKTSKKAYSLPTADARALREYVETVQKTLVTIPRLRFVLIVGGRPARTLGKKLADLEATTGIPIRFMVASELARLRECLPGPLPMGPFLDGLTRYGPILDADFVNQIVGCYHKEQSATSRFVGDMLSLGGVRSQSLPWVEGHSECEVSPDQSQPE